MTAPIETTPFDPFAGLDAEERAELIADAFEGDDQTRTRDCRAARRHPRPPRQDRCEGFGSNASELGRNKNRQSRSHARLLHDEIKSLLKRITKLEQRGGKAA
jgi:hypothetical protein